jgi:two-component system chemotaxis sensor kinase CheA
VHSTPGQGATFRIRLPLTLAILDGQLVRVGANVYIISLVSIIESLQVESANVQTVSGSTELYSLRSEYIPVLRLYDLFDVQPDSTELSEGLLVVVEAMGKKVALLVDELLGQQQVVAKTLGDGLGKVAGVSGGAILGDGRVGLILDVNETVALAQSTDCSAPRREREAA